MEKRIAAFSLFKRLKPAHKIFLSFSGIILFGSFLLCLPISAKNGQWSSYFDSLFTSVSAVCVVGLMPNSVGVHFSGFGQAVILLLIQIGGLGFMTITTFIMMVAGKKITLKDRIALREALNHEHTKGIVKLVRHIFAFTFILEIVGALIMMPVFIIDNGAIGIWQALFTSVSAFCNAGIDIFGIAENPFVGLSQYQSNVVISLTVSFLVIMGSVGFMVISDIITKKRKIKEYSLHSKVVLVMTLIIILSGFICFFAFEFNNPDTLKDKSFGTKLLASFFQAANCRTSGFGTIDYNLLSQPSKVVCGIFMFIGASPGSTGGGLKTTTVAVLILTLLAVFKNSENIVVGKKSLSFKVLLKAVAVTVFSLIMICLTALMLSLSDANRTGLENILHMSVSAFSNAGCYADLMPRFSIFGKTVIMLSMFIGRIGIITMGLIFFTKGNDLIKYPSGNIVVG